MTGARGPKQHPRVPTLAKCRIGAAYLEGVPSIAVSPPPAVAGRAATGPSAPLTEPPHVRAEGSAVSRPTLMDSWALVAREQAGSSVRQSSKLATIAAVSG